jgi:hypothetical protein
MRLGGYAAFELELRSELVVNGWSLGKSDEWTWVSASAGDSQWPPMGDTVVPGALPIVLTVHDYLFPVLDVSQGHVIKGQPNLGGGISQIIIHILRQPFRFVGHEIFSRFDV